MTPDITIRPYQADDLPALQRIREEAFRPVFRSFRDIVGEDIAAVAFAAAESEQAQLLNDICRPQSDHQIFVVEKCGDIIGFVAVSLDQKTKVGEIGLNAVDPAHDGAGAGTQLYLFALTIMKDAGMKVATVGTGGDDSHAPARRAYEKAGFKVGLPSVYYYRTL